MTSGILLDFTLSRPYGFGSVTFKNNIFSGEEFVSPNSRWPTPSKDFYVKEHRLSERFTSSSSSNASWRKRRSFEGAKKVIS